MSHQEALCIINPWDVPLDLSTIAEIEALAQQLYGDYPRRLEVNPCPMGVDWGASLFVGRIWEVGIGIDASTALSNLRRKLDLLTTTPVKWYDPHRDSPNPTKGR